jgi:hypothetical protein
MGGDEATFMDGLIVRQAFRLWPRYHSDITYEKGVDERADVKTAILDLLGKGKVREYALCNDYEWHETGIRRLDNVVRQVNGVRIEFGGETRAEEGIGGGSLAQKLKLTANDDCQYSTAFGALCVRVPYDGIVMAEGINLGEQEHLYNGRLAQTHVMLMYIPVDN